MVNEIRLRELFDAKLKNAEPDFYPTTNTFRKKFFDWFKFGFEASYQLLLTPKVADPLTPEKREALLKQLKDARPHSHIVVEPDSKLIFVYSWRSVQQRTMIILADSREEADSIFKSEEPNISPYVTQLFVDGGESTIIYNN
jgi:hypothetical protein